MPSTSGAPGHSSWREAKARRPDRRGEIWWVRLDERCQVVVIPGGRPNEIQAIRIVPPATAEEKRGFILLTGDEQPPATGHALVGMEVAIGDGVVRVALPRDGMVFCTWLVTLAPGDLLEPAGVLDPAKLAELENALRRAGLPIEQP